MLQLTQEFKNQVVSALIENQKNYDGTDGHYAKMWGINASVYSQLKNGKHVPGLLKDSQYLNIGRELGIDPHNEKWETARTDVFTTIEQDVMFCKKYSKARLCVDDCGIGKTYTAKYLSRSVKNCFYLDASQAKTKYLFTRLLAKTIGVDTTGRYADVKANLKYYLKMLPKPIIIIDEGGDLEYNAFLELKELWNATEGHCGWYMMGADGLRAKIDRGIQNKKVGFREIYSRYSERYTKVVPSDRKEKLAFYQKLITEVLTVNIKDKSKLKNIVTRCLVTDEHGNIGGLRRAHSLLQLHQ